MKLIIGFYKSASATPSWLRFNWETDYRKIELGQSLHISRCRHRIPEVYNCVSCSRISGQQDVTVRQSLRKVNLTHRYQLEEQLFCNVVNWCSKNYVLRLDTAFKRFLFWKKGSLYLKELYTIKMINGGTNYQKIPLIKTCSSSIRIESSSCIRTRIFK
jgi:hypothetical protein